jgi:CRISPR system Cascade subunit CasD
LVAGALGLERSNETAHLDLHRTLGFAVRIEAEGPSLRDYHTVQTPRAERGRTWATRTEELSGPRHALNTKLTDRYYLTGHVATVGLWGRQPGPSALAEIAEALSRPRFVPYLGRKSCPPVAPFAPRIVSADNLEAAFAAYAPPLLPEGFPPYRGRHCLYTDADAPLSGRPGEVRERRDGEPSRRRWTFEPRTEWVVLLESSR